MEGNRYPDISVKTASKPSTACVWIPVTFHDFSEGVLLLLLWSDPEQQFVPVKEAPFHGHKPSFRV